MPFVLPRVVRPVCSQDSHPVNLTFLYAHLLLSSNPNAFFLPFPHPVTLFLGHCRPLSHSPFLPTSIGYGLWRASELPVDPFLSLLGCRVFFSFFSFNIALGGRSPSPTIPSTSVYWIWRECLVYGKKRGSTAEKRVRRLGNWQWD